VEEIMGSCWERLWTKGGDRFYWIVEKDESESILCEDCLSDVTRASGAALPETEYNTMQDEHLTPISDSELEEILKDLEQKGVLKSFVDANGERYYIVAKRLQ